MLSTLNDRMNAASRLISEGNADGALAEARAILAAAVGANQLVRMNCAGLLIDAGERVDDEVAVREAVAILGELMADATFPAEHHQVLRYNFANGRAAILQLAERRRDSPDEHVRELSAQEEVVALYYDSSDSLRSATPETVINCATTLRMEGRVHEAIDLLDHVLRHHPDHPNAHMHMAGMLWSAFFAVRGRDDRPAALLVPALVHYERAALAFDAAREPAFAASSREGARRLRAIAGEATGEDVERAVADVGDQVLGPVSRAGAPLGLSLLSRSPYLDVDDPWLAEDLAPKLRDVVVDAAGTFAVGRDLLRRSFGPDVTMPPWRAYTPDAALHLRNAAVRQFWSVLEKVAWLMNEAFAVGIHERQCHFATLFRPPSEDVRKAYGLPTGKGTVRFHPNLDRRNPGLRALAGLSCAFDADAGVYAPLKRLRHGIEHRVVEQLAAQDDAAFLMGIARAALLHGVDAIVFEMAATARGVE